MRRLKQLVQRNPEGPERQFYSQISFPFYNIYLGIVMVCQFSLSCCQLSVQEED